VKTAQELLLQTKRLPLVAILRGLEPTQAQAVGEALLESGFRTLEVPLNRPGALQCIEILSRILPADALVGGGTMLTVADVNAVHAAGGRLMVAPNCDVRVITRALELDMLCAPGVVTPSEAFAALQAGAQALKIFPADALGHGGLKALKSVLPPDTEVWPVGGITPDNMAGWMHAGATGFGIGSQLYAPGSSINELRAKATQYIAAWQQANA
jgi:2-dehydro-3-deoxyphosphogalactonate aldolase